METIKARKIVALEDLAVEFKIRTQDVIQRIDALEQQGRLTGVMDDRGKVRAASSCRAVVTRCCAV